ncbi:MAG: ATP-binding cassette domain-containing protein [bacterium]|jgi:phospholipid/cholesterol/gamma-HCH transport system ATP-binding protein|nr:ATP-binding cassette domain-containing protein [Planctomycetota bacterium]HIL51370.1 ATP-binding cassette domain-containing protein [Planctomycetota bacterium]
MSAQPVIRFDDVYKSFAEQAVLAGLSFDVPRGKTLAIMGASGSGKSVTLRTIIGLLAPDSGRVMVEGRAVAEMNAGELSEMRRTMGYVFQEGALINWLSVGENIALPLRENTDKSDEEIRARVQDKLDAVHIPDAWDKLPSEISGGMKKRVGLARALVTEPEIILYDEPNAGLDPEIARSINSTIRELSETLNVTSIVVEHRLDCVRRVADEVLFLHAGKALIQLPPDEFFSSDHPRLQRFFGTHPETQNAPTP